MKWIEDGEVAGQQMPVLELTRRNLNSLLTKLGDPTSSRTLVDGSDSIAVRAVEDAAHYADRPPGVMAQNIDWHERYLWAAGSMFALGEVISKLRNDHPDAYVEGLIDEALKKWLPQESPKAYPYDYESVVVR